MKKKEENQNKVKKPVYKKWWFWVIIVFVFFGIIGAFIGDDEGTETAATDESIVQTDDESAAKEEKEEVKKIAVADLSKMKKSEIEAWAKENNVVCNFKEDYSDSVAKGGFVSQSVEAGKQVRPGSKITVVLSLGKKPSVEYLNALAKAKTYSDMMHMSKKGIYEQLTSEYGEQFSADAAQYAVDNLDANYKLNALEKAKVYQKEMSMSKNAIYDQLISPYGEKFTKEEAQYAVDHLPN